MSARDAAPRIQAERRADWRAWLAANHGSAAGVWLVTWRPGAGHPVLAYEAAIEEALCFGWIDGTAGRVDELRSRLYFAPRRPRSAWSASNRARVERLLATGSMAPAGLAAVERAQANGSWLVLESAERFDLPADLAAALDGTPPAAANFAAFSPSVRKMALGWVAIAVRPATRASRIAQIVAAAARNERPRG